jgi:hypothetical protein
VSDHSARQAAIVLLKLAKATPDPRLAAKLIEWAADLKDQAGELPISANTSFPNVVAKQ